MQAFKCDVTGDMVEGMPIHTIVMDLGPQFRLHIDVKKRMGQGFYPADVSKAVEEVIQKALAGVARALKVPQEPEEKPEKKG